MKKIIPVCIVAICILFIACNSDHGGMSATTKKNLEVNRAIMDAYEAGDFSKMGDYIAVDAIDHGGENGDVKGLDNIVSEMKRYRSQMKDAKSEIIKEMGDDEYVMTWGKMSGEMDGNKIEMSSLDISKFKDGKAIEHWVFMDPREMMKMMAPGQPAQIPATDTTAKK